MKTKKKLLLSALIALLVLIVGTTTVMAASSEKKLNAGKWVTGNSNTYYKITVKNDGYLTFSIKNVGSKKNIDMFIKGYKKVKGKYELLAGGIYTSEKTKTAKFSVEKGTYYFNANKNTKFKYTFTKAVDKPNYSPSRAIKLNKNKEVIVVNTANGGYDRWYVIKLTKKQRLTFWVDGYDSVKIYDSNLYRIYTAYDSKDYEKHYSCDVLDKGTYYVRICAPEVDGYYLYNRSFYTTFKWK